METQELSSGPLVLQVGVREGTENLQENITFSVESFPTSKYCIASPEACKAY